MSSAIIPTSRQINPHRVKGRNEGMKQQINSEIFGGKSVVNDELGVCSRWNMNVGATADATTTLAATSSSVFHGDVFGSDVLLQ